MPTATGDLAYTPFNHQHPFPPDLRMQRDTLNDRDVISAPIRWEGMLVYVLENQTTYQLRGGLTNEYWAVFVGGEGGDVSNAVLYTIQSLTPAQQLQARLNIGAGELMDGLISLGPVTSLVNDVTIDSVLARINGTNVGTNDPTTINVPVPTEGYTRRDLIVIDGSGLIYLVQGTEVLESQTAITPNVPDDTVVLVETFSNDTGLQDVYDFAYSQFVRFDVNNQGLSPLQRLNARTNIQAVSKDTDDIRSGSLRQEGLLTVIGDYRQEVLNGTSSTNAWAFVNPLGGGASFRRSGGLTVVSMGDSMTDYLIFRGFDNTGTEVFRVRQGGVTKGGDAINADDFVTLGQVTDLIGGGGTGEVTEMSGDDFFTGYRVSGADRIEQIFEKDDKDVIVTDTGNIILNPTNQVANFIFTGNDVAGVTELRGIETALDGREIHLTNRTGADFLIIDNYVGGPLNTAFNFGGTDYTFANGETISFIGDGTVWNPSVVNEIAFSDNLDSVNAITSIGPDNLEVITHVYDKETGNQLQFKEIAGTHTPDGVVIISIGSKYYKNTTKEYYIESFGKLGQGNDSNILQSAINGISKTDSKKLIIDGFDVVLTTLVTSATNGLTIEFRNGGQISQPVPGTNTTWTDQSMRLQLTGSDLTFINFKTDGKFNNENLNAVPSPVNHFCQFTGDNVKFFGKTILENSGGYNVDIHGDRCYIEDVFGKNNAYAGLRFFATGARKYFRVDKAYFIQNFGPIGRKTGITVNGQNYVDSIEIETYIGLNASLFTEADASSGITTPFYKKVNVGFYENTITQPTQTSGGAAASNTSGKMENIGALTINKMVNMANHATENLEGKWFNSSETLYIGELETNCGSWRIGKNTEIGIVKYVFSANSGDTIFNLDDTSRNLKISTFISDIPSGSTSPYVGIALLNSTSFLEIKRRINTGGVDVPLVRSNTYFIKDQVEAPNNNFIGTAALAFYQSVSIPKKYISVRNPENLNRDVVIGEEIHFYNNNVDHKVWIVVEAGTCVWSGTTFTGTARFLKLIKKKNYSLTALTNMNAYLTDYDIGMIAMVNGTASVWNGTATGWATLAASSNISSSVVLDFPVIASDANATLTATVTGAALGDNVIVAGPADIYNAGGRIDAWVSFADTVTVRVKNDGGSSIDPASGTFNIKVFK